MINLPVLPHLISGRNTIHLNASFFSPSLHEVRSKFHITVSSRFHTFHNTTSDVSFNTVTYMFYNLSFTLQLNDFSISLMYFLNFLLPLSQHDSTVFFYHLGVLESLHCSSFTLYRICTSYSSSTPSSGL